MRHIDWRSWEDGKRVEPIRFGIIRQHIDPVVREERLQHR